METDPHRRHMKEMTGVDISGCPWRSFAEPIVRETLHALRFFESGNLALALPSPSHRLMDGIGYWNQIYNRVQSKQLQLEREQREQSAQQSQSQSQSQRGSRRGR